MAIPEKLPLMKNITRMLLASAAISINIIAGHCFAASQVTMDLTGKVLQSGASIVVSSTEAIDHAQIYYYSITGTVVGSGTLAALTGTGTSLSTAIGLADPDILPYLQGSVFDRKATFPFTCVDKFKAGGYTFTSGPLEGATIYGTVQVQAGIDKNGVCYGKLSNVFFGFSDPLLGNKIFTDKTDSLTFENGQVLVQTTPIGGPAQPDLSFKLDGQLYGVGVIGTSGSGETVEGSFRKGQSYTLPVLLQNAGSVADTYTLSSPPPVAGFGETFMYKGKNVTAKVTGNGGFTIPPDKGTTPETLASGAITSLTWEVKNKSVTTTGTTTFVLTATSEANGSQDAIGFTVVTP